MRVFGFIIAVVAIVIGVPQTVSAQEQIRPDPERTPGVTNPDVTQDNIDQTICVSGWTATIRPPPVYTNRLKRQQIGEYGYQDTSG